MTVYVPAGVQMPPPTTAPVGLMITATGQSIAANQGWWYRCLGAGTISQLMAWLISTVGGNICMAVYNSLNNYPNNRLATTGPVTMPPTGQITLSLGQSLRVDPSFWFAIAVDTTNSVMGSTGAGAAAALTAGPASLGAGYSLVSFGNNVPLPPVAPVNMQTIRNAITIIQGA